MKTNNILKMFSALMALFLTAVSMAAMQGAGEAAASESDDESGVYRHMVFRPYESGEIQLVVRGLETNYDRDCASDEGAKLQGDEELPRDGQIGDPFVEDAHGEKEGKEPLCGIDALLWHIAHGHTQRVSDMLEDSAYVDLINTENENGLASLMTAVAYDRQDIMRILIAKGAAVNPLSTKLKVPPLFFAIACEKDAVGRILLDAKAEVSVIWQVENSMMTPLEVAMVLNKKSQIHMLLEVGCQLVTAAGLNMLSLAAFMGDPVIVRSILAYNGAVDQSDYIGCTPLMIACGCLDGNDASREIVGLLLDAQSDVTAVNNAGETALIEACSRGAGKQIVERLVMLKADVNAQSNEKKRTPLFNAALQGQADVVACLLEHNARVDEVNRDGITPLMIAAGHNKDTSVIKELVQADASFDLKDKRRAGTFISCILGKDHRPCSALDYAHTDEIREFLLAAKRDRAAQAQQS